ncbi:MAG TPA: VTT domain-containing protein [Methylomusa anaerophila]|uniref:SNARE associated Golgi protein n=1 Tax=Methylomusa anaerophila TaxID=1930071 RepID=A0A348AL06_9FIRM|nr:VTT domain-containing protein [Methylomusa anaerophila]BBB91754.1 SNARE associated Golgi protein [Methylomusa anaerophila]HML88509.1 VTT domain-containing protein [Methylomusa anaerophila]
MEEVTALLLQWGVAGLIAAAFTESFCSPILPDFVLIPLALASPEKALYYGMVATLASVAGGYVGHWIGRKIGLPAARKIIPPKYQELVQRYVRENAVWAIFLAALSPIPYKFVSITAGALGVRLDVFFIASFVGRAKRFLVEGVLIYYFGPKAVELFSNHSDSFIIGLLIATGLVILLVYIVKRYRKAETVSE